MADHLGYEPYDAIGRGSGNSRNGAYAKTVRTDVGPVELLMPRDREGTFEAVTVPKHVRRLQGLGADVISLYAKGLTTGERSKLIWLRSTTPGLAGDNLEHHRPGVAGYGRVAKQAPGSRLPGFVDRRDRCEGPR